MLAGVFMVCNFPAVRSVRKGVSMTGQDYKVLSNLLKKIDEIHSIREHTKLVYFLKQAMLEAEKRDAPHYYSRFHTLLITSQLSKRAFDTRLSSQGVRATASGLKLADNITIAVARPL